MWETQLASMLCCANASSSLATVASRRTSGQSLWLLRHYIGCFDMHVCLRPPCFLAIFLSKAFAVPFPSLVVSRAMFLVSSLVLMLSACSSLPLPPPPLPPHRTLWVPAVRHGVSSPPSRRRRRRRAVRAPSPPLSLSFPHLSLSLLLSPLPCRV